MTLPELRYGESPFDHWSREDLVRFAQRCYWAMKAADGVMALCRRHDEGYTLFWRRQSTGGRAVALTEAVIRQVGYDADGISPESANLWRAFYRPFGPLLFPDAVDADGNPCLPPRYICDVCGVWVDRTLPEIGHFPHANRGCLGTPRLMTTDDLPPIPAAEGGETLP